MPGHQQEMKWYTRLVADWSLLRLLRLVLAGFIAYEGVMGEVWWLVALAAVLFFQAVFNTGCGAAGCAVEPEKSKSGIE